MKKIFLKIGLFVLGLLLAVFPFGIFLIVANSQTHIYSKTYYAALVDKVHNLESHKNDKKIVLIGGSNVAFGFDSRLLENEFKDYKVVNFGLYAMLGTKIMMDLAIDYIGKGDMVFLIPEINSQSTSLYFNGESTLKALEDDMSIVWTLPNDNRDSVFGSYFDFVSNRGEQKDIINPSGVYQRKNFNDYGDVVYEELDEKGVPMRSRNRMAVHYDPTMMVDYSYSINQDFFDYVNAFNEDVNRKKAKLYYSFSPVNDKSVISKEDAIDYYWSIRNHLACDVIGNPNEYIIDSRYFYDSNFHLNDAGTVYRSYLLAEDIYRDIYKTADKPSFSIPDIPPLGDEGEIGENSDTAICFKYIDYEDSLLISGLNSEYLNEANIRLPEIANGKRVVGIAKEAFKDSECINNLVISSNIKILMDGCFGNCSSLKKVYIETHNPSDIIVSYTGSMTQGVSSDFRIHIHSDCLTEFATDYYWGAYSSFFVGY